MADMRERVQINLLLDFYGPLLTSRRRELLRLYCEEDLSLAEIADQAQITRQGVSDAILRAKRQLEDYEAQLGLAARYSGFMNEAQAGLQILETMPSTPENAEAISRLREIFNTMIQIER
ncbi:MAG: DNA-binding protein [Clostridia bacterium]|nr:DNA-binding protein [Clostridia bacterium]MBQ8972641.1 DNA-binding protein [Clostridia bacterium]